jgi:hypothetical protein
MVVFETDNDFIQSLLPEGVEPAFQPRRRRTGFPTPRGCRVVCQPQTFHHGRALPRGRRRCDSNF